ncbi:hypothetical protein PITCH_A1920054 [uncultured Desulfobacterium sp.]|uniref:Uncharacterized protein n=1 Tax=uncultured Desulfobacterium sp. TaxID=201089 RepID=A0A445MW81_9BACT|nr:hypothetical protein PITCH_A1920054 [uncultured Desulfobacterium sp.]
MDDQRLQEKFRENASALLSSGEIEKALTIILSLEKLDDVSALMGLFRIGAKGR